MNHPNPNNIQSASHEPRSEAITAARPIPSCEPNAPGREYDFKKLGIRGRRWFLASSAAVLGIAAVGVAAHFRAAKPDDDRCPACGERDQSRRLIYGLYEGRPPAPWGGCSIGPNSPKWYCYNCGHRWGRYQEGPEWEAFRKSLGH
jgi:hypothetical protein